MTNNKIIVAGGGTAGWLTALITKRSYPNADITLVESEEIGILGAGEGSTPILVGALKYLEIPLSDIIKNTDATIKNGIKFKNWSKNKEYFYHPFLSDSEYSNDFEKDLLNYFNIIPYKQNHSEKDYVLYHKISDLNKTSFFNYEGEIINDAPFSLHFNAKKLASYLRVVAESRGIKRIEGKVEDIQCNVDGYIDKIKINDSFIECDFIFDCTGFHRYIIGKYYKSEWKSHRNSLPAKKAIPFFIKNEDFIPPYTESIAMDYGWMWKIPTQERYGCGYVFDSDFMSDDDAIKEIEKYLGFEPDYPRKDKGAFSFEAGCYKKIWIKNCLAVGLSAGFVEPLEATSIMHSIFSLQSFLSIPNCFTSRNEKEKNKFNDLYLEQTNEIVDFIYLHYVTKKENTDFWKNFTKNNVASSRVEHYLLVSKERPLVKFDFVNTMFFKNSSYNYILTGNNLVNYSDFEVEESEINKYFEIIEIQNNNLHKYIDHKVLMQYIKNGIILI